MDNEFVNLENKQLDELKESIEYALASKSLYKWVCMTNKGYKDNRFGKDICNRVQEFICEDTFDGAFKILILISPPQHGKACEDNTPVLTTKGWKRHGDLVVGDYVYGVDGLPKLITHSQTSYLHDCVEVTLDSGDSFICAKEHEWVVECNRDKVVNGKRGQRQTEILEAQHIFDGYHSKSPAIKVATPLQNEDLDLPIDPYLLGVWLGDGHSSGVRITSHIDDYEEISKRLIKRGHLVRISNDKGNTKLISVGSTNRMIGSNYFLNALKTNNLIQNKHIPPMYINASYEQRLELLKGLMDTDGSVTKDGCICEYSGINETLVSQVYELVRSLGIKCSFGTGDAKLNGRVICKKYRVQFTPNKDQLIFSLTRKQNRINAKIKKDRNDKNLFFIKSVKECGEHSVKCITVDGGIYLVGKGFVPTHNSTNVTGSVPAWYKGYKKDGDMMILSYGDDLAKGFGRDNLIKMYEYGNKVFGVELEKNPCTSVCFSLAGHRGAIRSMGLTSGITGKPSILTIIDDPVKSQKEADSETFRNDVWAGFQSNVKTRLAAKAKVIVILTRWHEDDLAGRIQMYENLFPGAVSTVHYACECEDPENDPLGRQKGEFLSPELGKGAEWGAHMKASMLNDPLQGGKRAWDALYQGRPSAEAGNIISAGWFKFWKPKGMKLPPVKVKLSGGDILEIEAEELPDAWDNEIQSWDCTFKDKTTSDFVCGGYWGRRLACYYLLDVYHKVASFTETIRAIEEMTRKHPKATSKYIEDKANGSAIISSMRQKISGIVPIEANDDKTARLKAVSPVFESGNVYLPHPLLYPWVKECMDELMNFPTSKHDDYVDMTSQALNKLMYQSSNKQETSVPKGLWAYEMLIDQGFTPLQIRKAFMSGETRVLNIPAKYKTQWLKGR